MPRSRQAVFARHALESEAHRLALAVGPIRTRREVAAILKCSVKQVAWLETHALCVLLKWGRGQRLRAITNKSGQWSRADLGVVRKAA